MLDELGNWRTGDETLIWFHCASLGEFEQARPLIEALRTSLPTHLFLLTFYSPSGYEVRKDYEGVDFVSYLPIDLPADAKKFIETARPELVVLVKYEFWINHLIELHTKSIPVISVSSIFRSSQFIFGAFGQLHRKALQSISHFFVQNNKSIELLNSIGINHATKSGDTRFDRVSDIASNSKYIDAITAFKGNKTLWVIGSSWPQDMKVLGPFINKEANCKFIIAPHEINNNSIASTEALISRTTCLYSNLTAEKIDSSDVIIIDNVGMLSALYKSADFAYVGGGFGAGLHNILEPAAHGMPIFMGDKNYRKFQEASDLIAGGVAFPVRNTDQLIQHFYQILEQKLHSEICSNAKSYVVQKAGATKLVTGHVLNLLK